MVVRNVQKNAFLIQAPTVREGTSNGRTARNPLTDVRGFEATGS